MPVINTVDDNFFSLDGINYPRRMIAVNLPGSDLVRVQNVYDARLQLVPDTDFSLYTVNGSSGWANPAALMAALQPVVSAAGLGVGSLAGLSDTSISSPADNDVMQWNGVAWENRDDLIISNGNQITFGTPANMEANLAGTRLNLNLTAASDFRVRNSGLSNLFVLEEDTGNVTINLGHLEVSSGTITSEQFNQSANATPPANASDTGTEGEIRIDANYIYYCSATDTWVRAALATW